MVWGVGCGIGIYETQEDVVVIFRLVKFLLSIKLGWARRISITPGVTKGGKKKFLVLSSEGTFSWKNCQE